MHEHTQSHLLPECHDYRFIFHSSLWYRDTYRKAFRVWKRKVVLTTISHLCISSLQILSGFFFFLYPSLAIYNRCSAHHHPSSWVWESLHCRISCTHSHPHRPQAAGNCPVVSVRYRVEENTRGKETLASLLGTHEHPDQDLPKDHNCWFHYSSCSLLCPSSLVTVYSPGAELQEVHKGDHRCSLGPIRAFAYLLLPVSGPHSFFLSLLAQCLLAFAALVPALCRPLIHPHR